MGLGVWMASVDGGARVFMRPRFSASKETVWRSVVYRRRANGTPALLGWSRHGPDDMAAVNQHRWTLASRHGIGARNVFVTFDVWLEKDE